MGAAEAAAESGETVTGLRQAKGIAGVMLLMASALSLAAPAATAERHVAHSRPSPAALFAVLAQQSSWLNGAPRPFRFFGSVASRGNTSGLEGRVSVVFKGPYEAQEFDVLVMQSKAAADTTTRQIVEALKGHSSISEIKGSPSVQIWRWSAVESGVSSACRAPRLRCHESAELIQDDNVIVVAAVGSRRSHDTSRANMLRLATFAHKRVRTIERDSTPGSATI